MSQTYNTRIEFRMTCDSEKEAALKAFEFAKMSVTDQDMYVVVGDDPDNAYLVHVNDEGKLVALNREEQVAWVAERLEKTGKLT